MQDSCIIDWELHQKVMAKKNKNTITICTGVGLNMFFPEYVTIEIEKPINTEIKKSFGSETLVPLKNREIVALIAYLQRLGTDTQVKDKK